MKEIRHTIVAGLALAFLAAAPLALAHECPKYYDPEPTSPPGQDEVPRKGSMPFAHAEIGADVRVPPLGPGLTKVIAVDYPRTLDQSRQWLIGAGFQDVRDLGYFHPPDYPWLHKRSPGDQQVPCNEARRLVRQLDQEGKATSFYIGDYDWSDSRCNLYVFSAGAYIGTPGNLGRAHP